MCVCVYPEARNPHRIRWQSGRSRYEAIPSGTNKTWHKLSIRTQVLRLFVYANKKNKYIYVLSEMMQNRILVARRAATCRLGSWRPTGEVPLHLGRAMMMMHTSWSLASDTPLKTPVHISLSLSNLPALNTWSQKVFFSPTILHLTNDDWLFLSLSRSAPFSLSWIPTKKNI
jgi:hypothetical protein